MRKVLSKVQKVRAIASYQKKFETNLERADGIANRIYKAFGNPKTKFTAEQIKKVASSLAEVANQIAKGTLGTATNLRVAIASQVPTDKIVAHMEDAHTLLSKIAILKTQALASIAAEDDVTMDESGQLVDEPMDDAGEPHDDEAEDAEKTPEELVSDIHEDLDLLVSELKGEGGEEMAEEPEVEASAKNASKKCSEDNPKMPKENPAAKEVSDVKKLKDEYEKAPTQKNAKKKSALTQAAEAEVNPDMPTSDKDNPPATEEPMDELVDEFEANPSDPENLEMEDSMIDDAVNVEILSDGDVDKMEDEVVKGSTATLQARKLASAKKSSSTTPSTEDDVMTDIITSVFNS